MSNCNIQHSTFNNRHPNALTPATDYGLFEQLLPHDRASFSLIQIAQSDYWIRNESFAEWEIMTTSSVTSSTGGSQVQSSKKMSLKPEDFIKMMITQLQNQDPLAPAKNEELLAQMSQIGQLQSSTTLTDTLKGLTKQNQISSASALIGKTVQGLDDGDDAVEGVVSSIRVAGDKVTLELENGKALTLERVTAVSPTLAN